MPTIYRLYKLHIDLNNLIAVEDVYINYYDCNLKFKLGFKIFIASADRPSNIESVEIDETVCVIEFFEQLTNSPHWIEDKEGEDEVMRYVREDEAREAAFKELTLGRYHDYLFNKDIANTVKMHDDLVVAWKNLNRD